MVSREKSFENVNGQTDAQTDDRQKVITIVHPELSSGELTRGPRATVRSPE